MDDRRPSNRIDWGLLVLVVVGAQGFFGFVAADDDNQTTLIISGAALALLVLRVPVRTLSAISSNPLLIFTFGWFVVAALISPRPGPSLYAAAVLILMVAYLNQRESTVERTIQTFALGAALSLIPSIVQLITPLGGNVREQAGSAGGYAGYFPFNSWAGLCASAVLLSVVTLFVNYSLMWWHLPAAAGAALLLVRAQSATSYIALIAAVATLAGITAWRRTSLRYRPLVIVSSAMLMLLAALASSSIALLPTLADATGRDENLTNRTDIWQAAFDGIAASPFFGYGSGFWRSNYYWTSAQSGFLDFAINAGVPAALGLIVIVTLAGWRLFTTASPLLPFWMFGVVVNFSISQIAIPTVASLALWLAIASTASRGAQLRSLTNADDAPDSATGSGLRILGGDRDQIRKQPQQPRLR